MKKMTYKLYYGTEENCFEGEKLGVFSNVDELKECLSNNITDDVDKNIDVSYVMGLTNQAVKNGSVVFINMYGYEVTYIVTDDGRKARKELAEMRKECIEINF